MPRKTVRVRPQNAKQIYAYFAKALQEKRIFEKNEEEWNCAHDAFTRIKSTHDDSIDPIYYLKSLQNWIDCYVPLKKWQRCLATLRQIKSNKQNCVQSIKLNKETYTLLKNYADLNALTIQEAIHHALTSIKVDVPLKEEPITGNVNVNSLPMLNQIKILVSFEIENNSKYVHGKKKAIESVIYFLSKYDAEEYEGRNWEYTLTINYENNKRLDEIIEEIYDEIVSTASYRDCQVEVTICELNGEQSWPYGIRSDLLD